MSTSTAIPYKTKSILIEETKPSSLLGEVLDTYNFRVDLFEFPSLAKVERDLRTSGYKRKQIKDLLDGLSELREYKNRS